MQFVKHHTFVDVEAVFGISSSADNNLIEAWLEDISVALLKPVSLHARDSAGTSVPMSPATSKTPMLAGDQPYSHTLRHALHRHRRSIKEQQLQQSSDLPLLSWDLHIRRIKLTVTIRLKNAEYVTDNLLLPVN